MSSPSDLRRLVRDLESQGWRVDKTVKGHWRFIPPDGKTPPVYCAGTTSSESGWRNTIAALRRAGARVARDDAERFAGRRLGSVAARRSPRPSRCPFCGRPLASRSRSRHRAR